MTPLNERSCFAANGDIRIHYVVAGVGPLVLFLHGIPDCWNGWRFQLGALGSRYCVAAMDLRGFNLSDKPTDVRAYRVSALIGDVVAVLRDLGGAPAILVGHDWGALLAWWVAILHPELVQRLVVLSCPHPVCYLAARDAGELCYSQVFTSQILAATDSSPLDTDLLSTWVSDDKGRAILAAALRRSHSVGVRNYYRANLQTKLIDAVPPVRAPVLIFYGQDDGFIPPYYYDRSARHVAGPCEIIPIINAGHFVHYESAAQVTAELVRWLGARA